VFGTHDGVDFGVIILCILELIGAKYLDISLYWNFKSEKTHWGVSKYQ
jgi:hypothetical protein